MLFELVIGDQSMAVTLGALVLPQNRVPGHEIGWRNGTRWSNPKLCKTRTFICLHFPKFVYSAFIAVYV
jgi:hypothetical protein